MAGGGNGKEENYWPGFVDALSNVVLTLVFVLVVFVFALTIMANKASNAVEQMVQERLQEERKKASASQAAGGTSDSTALAVEAKGIELQSKDQEKKAANRGAAQIQQGANEITITYPISVLDLDDASMAALKQALEGQKEKLLTAHVRIESSLGAEPYSLAQRLAYYRAIRVRNMLIEGQLAKPELISNRVLSNDVKDLGHVRIIFAQ